MTRWTVDRGKTYDREVKHPDGTEETVTFRPLDAGDRAEFHEIRILSEGEGAMRTGRISVLMVERAVVAWTLKEEDGSPLPVTSAIINALEPSVFDQLYEHVSFGNPDVKQARIDALQVIEGDATVKREGEGDSPLRDAAAS